MSVPASHRKFGIGFRESGCDAGSCCACRFSLCVCVYASVGICGVRRLWYCGVGGIGAECYLFERGSLRLAAWVLATWACAVGKRFAVDVFLRTEAVCSVSL